MIGLGLSLTGQRTSASLASLLFGMNEPGFTFEPWDISTLYQDRAGTTPVTAAGQSVGLRLDKSKGLVLGPELVTNGDFATDTGWTLGGNWSISGGTLNGAAATSYSYIQAIGLNPSKTYRLLVSVTVSIGSVAINLGGINEVAFTSSGQKTATLLLDPSAIPFVYVSGSNFTGTIDNISVRELAGNHEVAVSDAKRGVYGWMPKTGKRNLLTYTEQFDNSAWGKSNYTVTANATTAPDGTATADLIVLNNGIAANPSSYVSQSITASASSNWTLFVYAKNSGVSGTFIIQDGSGNGVVFNAATMAQSSNVGTGTGTSTDVGNGWYRLTVTVTALANPTWTFYRISGTGDGTSGIYIWGAQLETGSTATAYQRVVSQYDITEAGVQTCYYVQADGVDDAYVTPTITPNTDKVQVFAGVRKLSDAAIGTLVELSTVFTNPGSFAFAAPNSVGSASVAFISTGTEISAVSSGGLAAPTTKVLTGLGDISGDRATLRVNGTQVDQSTADQGTGNFLAYPAYIYGRGGTSLPFNGLDFGHAVRFGPNLDAATIARVESLIARNTPEVTL